MITNAGGINPQGCVEMINTVAKSQGVELSVAMVTGDDLMQEVTTSSMDVYTCVVIKCLLLDGTC